MKRILSLLMLALPLLAMAQDNTWEQAATAASSESKYLAGAVPEVDGRVVFEATIEAPGKTSAEIYALVHQEMLRMTKEPGQLEQSRLIIEEPSEGRLLGSYHEWLVFKNKPLNLDRTRLMYNLIAQCDDGKLHLQLTRIHYLYDEERQPQTYRAEEWITDRYGLNRSKTKLARVSGKFRRKTIDRKDYLFNKFSALLNQ